MKRKRKAPKVTAYAVAMYELTVAWFSAPEEAREDFLQWVGSPEEERLADLIRSHIETDVEEPTVQ
jgi:hypothetical protein